MNITPDRLLHTVTSNNRTLPLIPIGIPTDDGLHYALFVKVENKHSSHRSTSKQVLFVTTVGFHTLKQRHVGDQCVLCPLFVRPWCGRFSPFCSVVRVCALKVLRHPMH